MAQSNEVNAIYVSAANVPTNIATIHTYAAPPKDFNPLTAAAARISPPTVSRSGPTSKLTHSAMRPGKERCSRRRSAGMEI